MKAWFSYHWLKVIAIFIVLGAITPQPLAYYQLMSWIVSGSALITALQAHHQDRTVTMWLFLFVAIIFNPFAPLALTQDIWQAIYLVTAFVFFLALLAMNPPRLSRLKTM